MRLQVEDRDGPDFEKARMVFNSDVYLNGKMAKYVTVADEEAGYIVSHTTDHYDNILLTPDGEEVLDHIETGVVQIVDRRKRDVVRT